MKKLVVLLTMLLTIVWTIPSISIDTSSLINRQISQTSNLPGKTETKIIASTSRPLSSKELVASESTGNITNQGLAVEDQDKIYYSDGEALWSSNKDGQLKNKILDKAYPAYIQTLEDKIYYINLNTSHIYKVNKDGSDNQRISQDKAYSLNLYNRRLYFMDRYNKLYITAMSLDGKDKKVIGQVVANDIMIYQDYIYYVSKHGKLGKMRIDGANHQMLKTDVIQFDVSKKGIYYTYDPRKSHKPKGLYQIDFANGIETQLLAETPYSFNVHKNTIYYNHPSKLSLYKMNLDGRDKIEITGANTNQINIAGDYIYYKNLEDGKKTYRINLDGSNRMALKGKTLVTNVRDLTKELKELDQKAIAPKLERSYHVAKDIVAQIIEPNMTDYEKAKTIHDYIVHHASYDIEAAEAFLQGEASDANAFTAYGILVNHKGVCQGYAEAAQILLSLAGLESDLVIGEAMASDGSYISHMWNLVKVDKTYYMLDVTWDDPVGPRDIILHDYFLVDSETLKKTHVWAYDEYPPCN